MRQVASGFAIGTLSMTLLLVPFMMVAMNVAPDYTTAVETVIEHSGIVEPFVQAVTDLNQARDSVMRPYTYRIRHNLFPRIP